jgi:VCBS repeat-containing protein
MKKFTRITQLMMIVLLSSSVCFAQLGHVPAKHSKSMKSYRGLAPKNLKGPEVTPFKNGKISHGSKALWDILLNVNVINASSQEAGIETDGTYIYTSKWSADMFYRYTMTGTFVDSFSVTGVSGIRDLAYDGTYFYGGANTATIYKMDFTNHTLVGSIACPAGTTVRNIAWDPILGGFWVGGWATDIICVSPAGTTLGTITAANHALTGIYGSAYDNWSAGGPYLWLFDQGTNGDAAIFNQISLTTFLPTGVTHACTDISSTALAGGAFSYKYNGTAILGGLAQGEKIFAYELLANVTVAHCDVAPAQFLAPLSSDSLTVSDTITVMVANHDTMDHFDIPIHYVIDGGTAVNDTVFDNIPAGGSIPFTFIQPYNFSAPGHTFNIVVYTNYACDTVNTNDTLTETVSNIYDVAPITIDEPSIIGPSTINPLATVQNLSSLNATFDVTMKIGTYTSTKTVAALAPNATQQVTFDPWTAPLGNDTIVVYTTLAADSNKTNDTITKPISVQNLIKAYCYVAYDPTSTLPVGPAYTYLQDPATIVSLADQSGENFAESGTWGLGNKWYGAAATENNLVTFDTLTGARTVIGPLGIEMTGMAFDYKTNTLFGIGYNSTAASSDLYRINNASGNATLIGTAANETLINLACDSAGNLYSLGIDNDMLYSIDKTTGLGTQIGSIGFDASYAQDMEFDLNSNTLYLAGFNNATSAGEMSIVNVVTGATTLVGTFAGGAEITGFAIPYNSSLPNLDAAISGCTSPKSSCDLANEDITINIVNFGTASISNFPISYSINGGTPVTETVSSTILSGNNLVYTFTQKADLSATGSYIIKVYTSLVNDAVISNDTINLNVTNFSTTPAPYSMGFEATEDLTGWEIIDVNNDGFPWSIATTGGHTGAYCAEYNYNSNSNTVAANDWLISNCIDLQSGQKYILSYWYKVRSATWPESFTVYIGDSYDPSLFTTVLSDHPGLTNTAYTQAFDTITVAASGSYHIGFYCNSDPDEWTLYLDDINLALPAALSVTASANPDSICQGMGLSSTLTATAAGGTTGNYSYTWSNSATTQLVTVTPSSTTTYVVTVSDGVATATNNVTVTLVDCTNINEYDANSSISIFPNPAKDLINITATEKINRIYVLNTFGQLISANEVNNTHATIGSADLADGIYYIRIETANGISLKKVSIIK